MSSTIILKARLQKQVMREFLSKFDKNLKFSTIQKLADHKRMVLKEGWFSDLEILEMCGQVCLEEYVQVQSSQHERKHKILYTKISHNTAQQNQCWHQMKERMSI